MQDRVLAPWGGVDDVKSSKDTKKTSSSTKDAKVKPKYLTSRKMSGATASTSTSAASKIYGNGKSKASSSAGTSKSTTKDAKSDKTKSKSSTGSSSKSTTKVQSTGDKVKSSSKVSKEKVEKTSLMKTSKPSIKVEKDTSRPSTSRSSRPQSSKKKEEIKRQKTYDKIPDKVLKETEQASSGRPTTSSKRVKKEEKKDDNILPNKVVKDKIAIPSEEINHSTTNGSSSRRASATRSRKNSTTSHKSESDNYSDDFNSYNSDFESDVSSEEEESESEIEDSVSREVGKVFNEPIRETVEQHTKPVVPVKAVNKQPKITSARAEEILSFVHLDKYSHVALNFGGMKYDSYMEKYGRRDMKQVIIQSLEVNEEGVQTEDLDNKENWTQHPVRSLEGAVGGVSQSIPRIMDVLELSRFLQSSSTTMLAILEENTLATWDRSKLNTNVKALTISEGFLTIGLEDPRASSICRVTHSTVKSNLLLVITSDIGDYKTLSLWDFYASEKPREMLSCRSSVEGALWGGLDTNFVVAYLSDCSLCVWDLRRSSPHQTIGKWCDHDVVVRPSAYNTALLDDQSKIVAIDIVVNTYNHRELKGKDVSIVSLDFNGVLNIWSLIDAAPEAGGTTDLGLAPLEKVKLVKSFSVDLRQESLLRDSTSQVTSMVILNSEFYIGTDYGSLLHLSRHGAAKYPKNFFFKRDAAEKDLSSISCVTSVGTEYVVICSINHGIRTYHTTSAYPLKQCTHWSRVVQLIDFSQYEPFKCLLLNDEHQLCLYDVRRDVPVEPIYDRVLSVSLGRSENSYTLILGKIDSSIEIHFLKQT